MKLNIHAINFEMADKLNAYIEKKTKRLEKQLPDNAELEIRMTVIKKETALNKETQVRIHGVGQDLFAEKVCDTFEQGLDEALAALDRPLEKLKDKK